MWAENQAEFKQIACPCKKGSNAGILEREKAKYCMCFLIEWIFLSPNYIHSISISIHSSEILQGLSAAVFTDYWLVIFNLVD